MRTVSVCMVMVGLSLPALAQAQWERSGWPPGQLRPNSRYPDVEVSSWHFDRWEPISALSGQKPNLRIVLDGSTDITLTSVAFSPNGKTLAAGWWRSVTADSGRTDCRITLWEVVTGKRTGTFDGGSDSIDSIAFSPDGKMMASAVRGQAMKVWQLPTGKSARQFEGEKGVASFLAFGPDSKTLAASCYKVINLWDVPSGTKRTAFQGQMETTFGPVALSPNGKLLASCGVRTVHGWDVTTILSLWDSSTGKNIANLSIRGPQFEFSALAFSTDSRTLASGRADGEIELWDFATGRKTATLHGHTSWIRSLAFSPDGRMLASGSQDGTVRLWDVTTGAENAILNGPKAPPGWFGLHEHDMSLAFSPEGTTLELAAVFDKTVRLWDVAMRPRAPKRADPPTKRSR